MRYPVDIKNDFSKSLLFWLQKFVKSKLNSLSNRQVKDRSKFSIILSSLNKDQKAIEDLNILVKEARNIGATGINTYYKPLEKLFIFLQDRGFESLKEIDEEVLSDFLSSQTGGLSDATKKNYRIALISFFGFIDKQNEGDDQSSYLFRIELKNWGGLGGKGGQKLPEYMKDEEIELFLEAIDTYPFTPMLQDRNRLLIKIIIYSGIRIGEALGLGVKDIGSDGDVYLIRVRGKGNKPRVVMIKKMYIEDHLKSWMNIRTCQNDLLFCNQKGGSLTQAYASRIVEQILMSVGIRKDKNGAHMLRHTFATKLYKENRDLVLVQEALGHASLDTSRIYTHFDKERLKAASCAMDNIGTSKKGKD